MIARCHCFFASAFALLASANARAQAPQTTVVPAAFATADANSYLWVAGASRSLRQQTLIGSSHLTALLGRSITALELRRTARNQSFPGGTIQVSVALAVSPRTPLRSSRTFAANLGTAAVTVFTGAVALPASPATAGPTVPWTASNTVRIAFQTPFVYTGGTLCVDLVAAPVAGQLAHGWLADAVFEDVAGTIAPVGAGCGGYGGPSRAWSAIDERKLVPGAHADFFADGPHNALGFAVFGTRSAAPIPLTMLGLPSPGCELHLASIDAILPAIFVPEVHPLLQAGPARADVQFWIPDDAAVFGTSMTTQWFEFSQLTTSNAIEWAIAAALPSTDLTSIEGDPNAPEGNVAVGHAHVLRFESQ